MVINIKTSLFKFRFEWIDMKSFYVPHLKIVFEAMCHPITLNPNILENFEIITPMVSQ